jgi:hypothetical protein
MFFFWPLNHKRIDDDTEIQQQKEVKIRREKHYGYHHQFPAIHEIDQSV